MHILLNGLTYNPAKKREKCSAGLYMSNYSIRFLLYEKPGQQLLKRFSEGFY